MDSDNYLEIPREMRSRHIYRIISMERLFELFENRQNVLVKPKKWQDPFENFILRAETKLPTGQLARFSFHDQFYGQCWTLQSASDAMWRIYSPASDAVRIRSTINTVATSLSKELGINAQIRAFIGKVRYLSKKHLLEYASGWFPGMAKLDGRTSAETLLVKRPAFKHEREIRLLFFQPHAGDALYDLYLYNVNPHEFIDQIMIDPRITEGDANALKKRIRRKTDYQGKIVRSLLYSPPPSLIVQGSSAPDHLPQRTLARERR